MQPLQMNSEVTGRLKEATQDFKAKLPVIVELGNPAMRPRHWQKLFKARVRLSKRLRLCTKTGIFDISCTSKR